MASSGLMFTGSNSMVISAVVFPYWNGNEYVVSSDEKIAGSEHVSYGQGGGVGAIAAWLDGDFGFLALGSERRVRKSFEAAAPEANGGNCVHYGEGHVVLRVGDLFLVFSRWDRSNVALLSKRQIVNVLDLYSSFRSVSPRKKERPPTPFEFEYEAEGEEAVRRFVDAGGDIGRLEDEL